MIASHTGLLLILLSAAEVVLSSTIANDVSSNVIDDVIKNKNDRSHSKNPLESFLIKDLLQDYDKVVKPGHQVKLQVGQTFLNMFMNLLGQELTVKGWLILEWNDDRLAWDPKEWDGIDEVRIPLSEVWTPDVTIYTSVKGCDVYQSTALALIRPTGQVLFIPAITHTNLCESNFKDYPYGVQNCTIKIGSWTADKSQIEISPRLSPLDFEQMPKNMIDILSHELKAVEKKYDGFPKTYQHLEMNLVFKYKKPKGLNNHLMFNNVNQVVGPEYGFGY